MAVIVAGRVAVHAAPEKRVETRVFPDPQPVALAAVAHATARRRLLPGR